MARLSNALRATAEKIYSDYLCLRLKSPDAQNKVIVLVEGVVDVPFYSNFFNLTETLVTPCFGCNYVTQIQKYLKKKNKKIKHCITIIDSDFSNITGRSDYEPDHFYTSYHDVEMGLVAHVKVFENALRPLGINSIKFQQRTAILQELSTLSMAKFFNMARQQKLTTDGTGLDLHTLSSKDLSSPKSISQFFQPTNPRIASSFRLQAFERFNQTYRGVDLLQLTNGHDFLCRWAYRIKRDANKDLGENELRDALVAAYKATYIKDCKLYKAIREYADSLKLSIMAYN